MEDNKYSTIFKKNFAITMIKPDGLDGHVIDVGDKAIIMNKDFIVKDFSKIIPERDLYEKSFQMNLSIFQYYKPTKTRKKSYLDYHLGENHKGAEHVAFLILDEEKHQPNGEDNLVSKIYKFKKEFRKKYSEQERQRDKETKTKKSVKTLIHSPEDSFELISNLALFFPEKFEEFIDIEKIELIKDLKEKCCEKKISELKESYYDSSRESSISSDGLSSTPETSPCDVSRETEKINEEIAKRIRFQYDKFFEIIKHRIEEKSNYCEYADCQRKQLPAVSIKRVDNSISIKEEKKKENETWVRKCKTTEKCLEYVM